MKKLCAIWFLICTVGIISGCKKPYVPNVTSTDIHALVVEGVINIGTDSTIINLSRTAPINQSTSPIPEKGAKVLIESNGNDQYPLTDAGDGSYYTAGLNLGTTKKYRLHIVTADGNDYVSDYTQGKFTPPIDSIGWKVQNGAMVVYANSHDATNNTRYYRFEYNETWQFHAKYESAFVATPTAVVPRDNLTQNIYICYTGRRSANILLGSTAGLSADVLSQSPLTTIATTEERIESEYYIMVKEYALDKDAYNFWSQMEKNTESLGSIFDVQPSANQGNIHCTNNSNSVVIGYVSASTVTKKSRYITRSELPAGWTTTYPYQCGLDSLFFVSPSGNEVAHFLQQNPPYYVPVRQIFGFGGVIGYLASSYQCADCTIRGSNKRPSFWPAQ